LAPAAPHSASHTPAHGAHALGGHSPRTGIESHDVVRFSDLLIFGFFCCLFISVLFCCLGFSLPLGETFVSGFVLVPLFFAIPDLDYFSAFTASAIFKWLLF
jgi:hypothetical protein